MIGALGLCPLSFVSTFPVVVFLSDAQLAPRVSYDVAIVMRFCCGYVFGYHSGLWPWAAGISMVALVVRHTQFFFVLTRLHRMTIIIYFARAFAKDVERRTCPRGPKSIQEQANC
jgi:hypothetical protein